jgi:hypothetical protein
MRVALRRPSSNPRPRLNPATAIVESPSLCAAAADDWVPAADEVEDSAEDVRRILAIKLVAIKA